MAPMDPQYVSALREAKSLLDDGVFSQKEFEEEKQILKERFHVSQPGVSPAAPAPALFHVSQPGVSPAAPTAAPAPRMGMSDSESRHPLTGRYLIDYRKCSKCPLDTCFLHKSQFSPHRKKRTQRSGFVCNLREVRGSLVVPALFKHPQGQQDESSERK